MLISLYLRVVFLSMEIALVLDVDLSVLAEIEVCDIANLQYSHTAGIQIVFVSLALYNIRSIQLIGVNYKIQKMKNQLDLESEKLQAESRLGSESIIKLGLENGESINEQDKDEEENGIQQITSEGWPLCKCIKLALSAVVGVVVVLIVILVAMSGASTNIIVDPLPTRGYFSQFTSSSFNQVLTNNPAQYIDVDKAKPFKQLPICVIIKPQLPKQQKQAVISSIKAQQYRNYIILDETNQQPYSYTFSQLWDKITRQCPQYSILLFVNEPLADNSLNLTCQYYQVFNMWMAYSILEQQSDGGSVFVEVSSMYVRLFQLVLNNDFYGEFETIKSQDVGDPIFNQYFVTALFQLCRFNAKNVTDQSLYSYEVGKFRNRQNIFIWTQIRKTPKQSETLIARIPFEPLLSLDQDYRVDVEQLLGRRAQFYNSNVTLLQRDLLKRIDHQVTHRQFEQLLQLQQIIYLAPEHSLCTIDRLRMVQKYDIEKYSDTQSQLPLCVCIFSHNNEQNNREKKIIRSIVRQNYHNFHIVFVDDYSTDHTLSETMRELQRLKFPKNRVTLVQNLNHKYATYNYVNTAFSFCHQDDIQIIMDGDDQLIGQNVFHFVNTKYQADPTLWLMHTFYKTNRYGEGFNLLPFTNAFVFNMYGGRRFMYFISPLRTWSVKLFRSLPLRQHLSPLTGQWYDTACDVALEYGLFEMAGGQKHGKYFPEINYLYFTGYGGNDDSTLPKNLRRNIIHFLMTLRFPLKPLQNLQEKWENKQIVQILQKDRGIEYTVVKFGQNQL